MSFLEEFKSKSWFPWAAGGGAVLLLFWILFWSTPEPGPTRRARDGRGRNQQEGLYDLKIGSWQNRVDQDLEATKKQIAGIDLKQQEIGEQLDAIGDSLSALTLQMKQERQARILASRAAPPVPEQKPVESGITVLRFGAGKSSVIERPLKVKAETPAVRQTGYLPGGSMARSVLLPALMLRSEESLFLFSSP